MRGRNVEGAAEYLGVSVSFLNNCRVRGDGPQFYKIGRRVRYEDRDLDAWLESRRRQCTSEYSQEAKAA